MTPPPADDALGQLQRGRGAGVLAAMSRGAASHDDLFGCIVADPRREPLYEERARCYAELLLSLDAPVEPLATALAGRDPGLAHAVLAGALALGHTGAQRLLSARGVDEALARGVALELFARRWLLPVQVPPPLRRHVLLELLADADCAAVAPGLRRRSPGPLGAHSITELLELGRGTDAARVDPRELLRELCLRDDEAGRQQLADCLATDVVYGRVRLAARALGSMGDERMVELAVEHFGRATEPPTGFERMRRSALADYVAHLPEASQRALARNWHERGGYFRTVAGTMLAETACAGDRERLEVFVQQRLAELGPDESGYGFVSEIDALARIADPRSAPLLCDVVERVDYAPARRRALHGLALLPERDRRAAVLLDEALWDCEDEAAADACAFGELAGAHARRRCEQLATLSLADPELRLRARRRLARGPVSG